MPLASVQWAQKRGARIFLPHKMYKNYVSSCIRKEGHRAMNGDQSSYQLSHSYDRLLDATADHRVKTRKN